jgi:hypothetical protein
MYSYDKMKKKNKGMAEGGVAKDPLRYEEGFPLKKKPFAKGGAVMGIVAKLKKVPSQEAEMESEEEMPEEEMGKSHREGMKMAAKEMLMAMKKDDPEAFAQSLMNFMEMHGMSSEGYEE